MTKVLVYVAILLLIISLGSTLLAIWLQLTSKGDFLRLTELLLSWKVIVGGLATAAGYTFRQEIKRMLK